MTVVGRQMKRKGTEQKTKRRKLKKDKCCVTFKEKL